RFTERFVTAFWTNFSSFHFNDSLDLFLYIHNPLFCHMSSILFLLFPILSRFISFYALTKTNFLLVVIKMSKSKDSAKFAINFLADLCCWLFALISIIYSGQCISRQLYLRPFHSPYKKSKSLISRGPELWFDCPLSPGRAVAMLSAKLELFGRGGWHESA